MTLSAPTPRFRLELLGPPRLQTREGGGIEFPLGKPLALLAYLALQPEPSKRDALATLLWSGAPRDRARASLRQALWTLRKILGPDIVMGDDPIELQPGSVETDIRWVVGAMDRGDLETALTLWAGPPLLGLDFPDAPEWERWAEDRRFELSTRLGGACFTEGMRRRDPSRGRVGIDFLEKARDLTPDQLEVHVGLIESLLDLRAFAEAESALSGAREALDDVEARTRLDGLSQRLRRVRGSASLAPLTSNFDGELVGREEERAALLRRWRLAGQGTPGTGLLIGPTGIGKTRLSQELRGIAEAEGARVVALKAEDSERPIEWGILTEIVQQLLRLSGAAGISPASDAVLRSLIPSLSAGDGHGSDEVTHRGGGGSSVGAWRARPSAALADALTDLMTAVSEDAPLLLLLDDLHWADTESRAVLTRVATRLSQGPILFLLTCRTDVEEPRIRKTLALLSEAPSTTLLELAPFTLAETEALFRTHLRFEPEHEAPRLLDRIHRTTRGNPLFLLELLKAFEGEGIIEIDGTGARVFHTARLPPEIPLPESVRALVERQLDHLSNEAALVAAHLARIGHAATPRRLGLQTGLGTSAVTNGIGELLQRRMVRWDRGESLVFVHDELRAAVAGRYQMHVGLTTGGGAQWSFFRSTVLVSAVAFVVAGFILFSNQGGNFGRLPHGGGVVVTLGPDGAETGYRLAGPFGDLPKVANPEAGSAPPSVQVHPTLDEAGTEGFDLYLKLEDGTLSPRFAQLPNPPAQIRVSKDLATFAWVEPGIPDQVHVMGLGGTHIATEARPHVVDLGWCGRGRLVLLAGTPEGVEALVWTPGNGIPVPISLRGIRPGNSLACAPDERSFAFIGARSGQVGLFLHDLGTGATTALELPGTPELTRVVWRTPSPAPIPLALRMAPQDSVSMGIGGQRTLRAEVIYSDGSRRAAPMIWTSEDPEVATVSPSGVVTAVRPGMVRILGTGFNWLTGETEVEVRTDVEVEPRLRALVGPSMLPPTAGSEPAERASPPTEGFAGSPIWAGEMDGPWLARVRPFSLRLQTGQGSLSDALDLDPSNGLTLEVEFRILRNSPSVAAPEMEREAHSAPSIEVCISPETPAGAACVRYPAASGARWNPREIAVHSGPAFPPTALALRTPFSPSGWIRAALTVDPQGMVHLFVDDYPLGQAPLRITSLEGGPWQLHILAEAGLGEVDVRRVRVWEGVRYRLPPGFRQEEESGAR